MRLIRYLTAMVLLAAVHPAFGQSSVLQGGPWTPGHAPMYVGQGSSQPVVQDGGSAGGGPVGTGISELGLIARGTGTAPYAGQGTGPYGTNACDYDAPTDNPTGYHFLCLSANAQGGGLLAYGNGGAATALPLSFIVNGATYAFPFTVGGIVGPSTSVVNDAACWNNTTGTLLKDCGAFVTVGGNNTWTGTNNFTGTFQIGSVTQNFPASGNIVGTSDTQSLTNKSISGAEINSGTLPGTVMPAFTGDVTNSAGSLATTISAGVVTNAKLAVAGSANTVKGAATSTAIADLAVPSCSAAGNALQWVTGTGFQCGTLTNQSAGWGLTGSSTFSISTSAPPYGYDVPINMALTASVNASALTINLVAADSGSTPSATHPVLIPFRSTTLATGTVVWTAVTGALSIVVPSAATLGTTNSVPFRIWIFAAYNSGTPEMGVAVCSISPILYPCTAWEYTRKTTVSIDGFATSGGVLYTTSGVSSDAVRIIGYADYASGLATAGAYASTPTTLQVMGPGVPKPGAEIQIAQNATGTLATGTTVIPFDNTIPQIIEGDQYMTQAITPSSTINLLQIDHTANYSSSKNGAEVTCALFQDSTANALAANTMLVSATNTGGQCSTSYFMQAGTASATTFRIRAGADGAGTTSFNGLSGTQTYGGAGRAFLRIREIMGALPYPANDNANPGVFALTG